MVGFNYGYAPLNEVWGDMSGKKKKKSKSTHQDPVCDLYEMKGNSSAYSETELVNYVYDKARNQRTYNDKQPKVRTVVVEQEEEVYDSKPLPKSLFESQFDIKHPGNFDMEDPKEYMVKACSASQRDDEGEYLEDEEVPKKNNNRQWEMPAYDSDVEDERPSRRPVKEVFYEEEPRKYIRQERKRYVDEEDVQPPRKNKQRYVYLDILLYVLSGIILIFLLEQFVRIGINMQMV
jgi:hypothetical protein